MSKVYKTNLMVDILDALKNSTKPVSATDIVKKFPTKNKSSIYRQLEKLEQSGNIRSLELQVNNQNYFEYKSPIHSHFVCKQCKDITCLDDIEILNVPQKLSVESAELVGFCNQCN